MDLTTREPQVMVGSHGQDRHRSRLRSPWACTGSTTFAEGLEVVQMPVAVDGTLQMILTVIVAGADAS